MKKIEPSLFFGQRNQQSMVKKQVFSNLSFTILDDWLDLIRFRTREKPSIRFGSLTTMMTKLGFFRFQSEYNRNSEDKILMYIHTHYVNAETNTVITILFECF